MRSCLPKFMNANQMIVQKMHKTTKQPIRNKQKCISLKISMIGIVQNVLNRSLASLQQSKEMIPSQSVVNFKETSQLHLQDKWNAKVAKTPNTDIVSTLYEILSKLFFCLNVIMLYGSHKSFLSCVTFYTKITSFLRLDIILLLDGNILGITFMSF